MERFAAGAIRALRSLSIQSGFRRKNDLEVNGRKIAGLGIYRDVSGGLLFHASLLLDMDISLMLQILNTPFEKTSDKGFRTIEARIETIRHAIGRSISMEEVRKKVAEAYARTFGVEFLNEGFTPDEIGDIRKLEREKYRSNDWIYQNVDVPDTTGSAKVKTPNGLLDVSVSLAGDMIKAVWIRGDFFTSEQALSDLEANLRWHTTRPGEIARTLVGVYRQHQPDLVNLPVAAVQEAIEKAVQRGKLLGRQASSEPYGCFVTPGAVHV
jgi:lipoate-protein ligase A